MKLPHYILQFATACILMVNTACKDGSEEEHLWGQYDTQPDPSQTYIDNDEYYVAPTGGYVTPNDAILDPD